MANDAKEKARQAAEARQAKAEDGSKDAHGHDRNKPEQLVHKEGELGHQAHAEDPDMELAELYETNAESEVLEWRRHSDLDAPPARDGYVNRFIRIRLGTARDTQNWRNSLREGWRPVLRTAVPDRSLPSIHLEGVGDVIGVEDLILCEMPKRTHQQRMDYYREKKRRQDRAIQRQLDQQSVAGASGFGAIEQARSSSVSVPRRQVEVAGDE